MDLDMIALKKITGFLWMTNSGVAPPPIALFVKEISEALLQGGDRGQFVPKRGGEAPTCGRA
jgi:hypothetical protein